jgi:hypothetical protein
MYGTDPMSPSAEAQGPMEMVKPFVWLGVTGFLIGFALCLAVGMGRMAARPEPVQAAMPSATLRTLDEPPLPDRLAWKGERIT